MLLYELEKLQNELENKLELIQAEINDLPEGRLNAFSNGKYVKWYKSNGSSPTYIPKSQSNYAKKLALRRYKEELANEISSQINIVDSTINQLKTIPDKSAGLLTTSSPYHDLICSELTDFDDDIKTWLNTPFERKDTHSDSLIHQTIDNHIVRSKSEVIIANLLYLNKIPYLYELPLYLGNNVFYPDFTIKHPVTKKLYYWEHFGMMDNSSYSDTAFKKLNHFCKFDIVPSINLITTFETSYAPIDSNHVQRLIQEYFL